MADRFFGVARGADEYTVTNDSSTTSKAIELRFDTGVASVEEVIIALEKLGNAIQRAGKVW